MAGLNSTAKNLEEVRESNLALVMKLLHKMKNCSRAEISEKSGLKQSTITNIVNVLIDSGLVRETGSINGKKGRRSIGIMLDHDAFYVIGIRITRSGYSIGCFNLNGNSESIMHREYMPNDAAELILEDIKCDALTLIRNSQKKVVAIGLAVPGPFFMRDSRIMLITGARGWENIDFSKNFSKYFDIPVYIEHDANAGALAEWWYSVNNLESGTYIYVAAGYGIGAGIIIDGKVFHGAMGIAGEIGHMSINVTGPKCVCGNRGCLEMYSSTNATRQYVKSLISQGRNSCLTSDSGFTEILEASQKGDSVAKEAIERSVDYLGFALVNLINTYNPDIIIIGDELSLVGEALLKQVRQIVKDHTLLELYTGTKIELSSFTEDPALIGAAALAFEESIQRASSLIALLTTK